MRQVNNLTLNSVLRELRRERDYAFRALSSYSKRGTLRVLGQIHT